MQFEGDRQLEDQNQRLHLPDLPKRLRNTNLGLKHCCEAERAQVRSSRAQRNHIGLFIRAFLHLELHWFATGCLLVPSQTWNCPGRSSGLPCCSSLLSQPNCVTPT